MTDAIGARRLWPRGLPCPDLKAISFTPDGGELATEMESGTRRNRQLYDTLPTTYKATMTCDRIESVIFMSFYKEVAGAEFEIDVHSPFALVPSLTRHRAQFLALPDITEAGSATWKVSVTLWLAEVSVPDFDTLAFLAAYGSESGAMVNRFDTLSNVDIPNGMKLRNALRGTVSLPALQLAAAAGTISSGALALIFPASPILIGTAQQMSLQARLAELTPTAPWYDPSDLTSLYQARTGGANVSAGGQTVGVMLDKSRMGGKTATDFIAGHPELRATAATGLVGTATAATYDSGTGIGAVSRAADSSNQSSVAWSALSESRYYLDIENTGATGLTVRSGAAAGTIWSTISAGARVVVLVPASSNLVTLAALTNSTTATFIVHSFKALPGFHAIAPSDAARPLYGREPVTGRRNIATRTNEIDNAMWSKVGASVVANQYADSQGASTLDRIVATAGNGLHYVQHNLAWTAAQHTISFEARFDNHRWIGVTTWDGVTNRNASFDLQNGVAGATSGGATNAIVSLGGGLYRCSVTLTPAATAGGNFTISHNDINSAGMRTWNPAGTEAFGLGRVQVELGATATAYQDVVTAQDITEAGVASRHFLQADGVDDWMQVLPAANLGEVWAHVGAWSRSSGAYLFAISGTGGKAAAYVDNSAIRWRNVADTGWDSIATGLFNNIGTRFVLSNERTSYSNVVARVNGAGPAGISGFNNSAEAQGLSLFSGRNDAFSGGLAGRFYGGAWAPVALPVSLRGMLEQHFAAKAGVTP